MEVKALFLHYADELGLSEDTGLKLHDALEPMISSLGSVMDLGIYFHSVTRCETVCKSHDLPEECSMLLWTTCVSLRDQLWVLYQSIDC